MYNEGTSISSRSGIIEDLHSLVDLVKENDTKLVYNLIRVVIEKDHEKEIVVEADNSPLTEQEKKILKQAEIDIENNDLFDWDNLRA